MVIYTSRGYRDNIDQKSGVFFRSLTLIPNPRGVDHRTVAQESRAAPVARREAPGSAGKHPQRRTAFGNCGNKLKC